MKNNGISKIRKYNTSLNQQDLLLKSIAYFLLLTSFLFIIDFVPELEHSTSEQNILFASENKILDVKSVSNKSNIGNINKTLLVKETPTFTEKHDKQVSEQIPVRVVSEKIGLDTIVTKPKSEDLQVLDNALLKGAVYYPDSGYLGENSNVLIFGHSSYLPVVRNKAFKAFNELKKLEKGDEIKVYSNDYLFVYSVQSVELHKAQDVTIEFYSEKPTLTLTTCNSFGSEEDRWVVISELTRKEKI